MSGSALFIFALELESSDTNTSAAAAKYSHHIITMMWVTVKSDMLLNMGDSTKATGDITDRDRLVLVMDRTMNENDAVGI